MKTLKSRTITRCMSTMDITAAPNFQHIHPNFQKLASHLSDLGPFPPNSPYLNGQHYYQNTVLLKWANMTPHPVTLMHLAQYGRVITRNKIIASANFVRLELPIRIALKLQDLQRLPFEVVNNYHLAKVYESYYEIFEIFRKYPEIRTVEDNDRFCDMLEDVLTDVNLLNLPNLMMGALECSILGSLPRDQLDELISSLLRARISRRLIIEEHLSLTRNFIEKGSKNNKDPQHHEKSHNEIGDIFFKCSAREHLKISADNASKFIESVYPGIRMPKLIIEGSEDLHFQFLTTHLHFMLGEILRNSYETSVRHFIESNPSEHDEPPPVSVSLIDNKDHVAFRFSDRGGGVDIDPIEKVWSFGKDPTLARQSLANFHRLPHLDMESLSTRDFKARESLVNTSIGGIDDNYMKEATLINLIQRPAQSKLGLGLAMCKVYADYWNGDVVMHSMKGYGTDTFLKLGKLGYYNDKLQLDRA